jgi:hypothetical protein
VVARTRRLVATTVCRRRRVCIVIVVGFVAFVAERAFQRLEHGLQSHVKERKASA